MNREGRPYPYSAPEMDGYINAGDRELGDRSGRPLDCGAAEAKLIREIEEAASVVLEDVES